MRLAQLSAQPLARAAEPAGRLETRWRLRPANRVLQSQPSSAGRERAGAARLDSLPLAAARILQEGSPGMRSLPASSSWNGDRRRV